jgi:hypothetical protein
MKFEISYVCYQYLGCSWVTYWRNNFGIKINKKKKKKEKKKERKNNIDHFELFAE